ncbi:unnamed protein product [Gulo gulo]|uniref:Uncharacterized protein n=1 Tax=Gulo gulo TaxID=48420 RepID=A0A9X9LC81_GULGU|nr:unnamed protein product [Gulo gulo]
MTPRNLSHKDMNLFGGRPQVPEEHGLCQKKTQQEGPRENAGQQHQGHECTCRHCQGPHQPQGGQAQDPNSLQPQASLTCLRCSAKAQEICSCPQAPLDKCQGQGSNQSPGCGFKSKLQPLFGAAQVPKISQAPTKPPA